MAETIGHQHDMYTNGMLNESYASKDAERAKRTMAHDETCKSKLTTEADFEGFVELAQVTKAALVEGETVLSALVCVGMKGMANAANPEESHIGKGLAVITKNENGNRRLHFLMQGKSANFRGMEAWEATKACGCCCKRHDILSEYHVVHGQELRYSVASDVVPENVFMTLADKVDMGVKFSTRKAKKDSCCKRCMACCCKCLGPTESGGGFEHSATMYVDPTVKKTFGSGEATHQFPKAPPTTSTEAKAFYRKQLWKIEFLYEDDDGPNACELWSDPTQSLTQVTEFVRGLSAHLEVKKASGGAKGLGGLFSGAPEQESMDVLPATPAPAKPKGGARKSHARNPCTSVCACCPTRCCGIACASSCATCAYVTCVLPPVKSAQAAKACVMGAYNLTIGGCRKGDCCHLVDYVMCCICPDLAAECHGCSRWTCSCCCPCCKPKTMATLGESSFPWQEFPMDDLLSIMSGADPKAPGAPAE